MTLQEAVKQADEHLVNGGTFPQGEAGNCFKCPIARYLTNLMGSASSIHVTRYCASDDCGKGQAVDLTPALCAWIEAFDAEPATE